MRITCLKISNLVKRFNTSLNFYNNSIQCCIVIILTICCINHTNNIFAAVSSNITTHYSHLEEYDEYDDELCLKAFDKYERFNRKMFYFNLFVAYYMVRPFAVTYDKMLNQYTKNRVDDFFYNAKMPFTSINSALQRKGKNALLSMWEFIINSTLGMGGIYNVAKDFGLKSEQLTFSSTLAHYGVRSGPYIIMPLLGAMTIRDIPDIAFMFFPPFSYIIDYTRIMQMANLEFLNRTEITISKMVLKQIHDYAKVMRGAEFLFKNSLDPYAVYRDSYYQKSDYSLRCKFNK